MFNNANIPSLSDIAAVTGNNDGFGGNNGWWVLIILFALFGGWGNGNRGFYGGGEGAADNYVLASDFANIERKIDGVNNGLCDGFYAMNTGMLNGFNANNVAMLQGFNGVQTGQAALANQMAQCCCDNKAQLADLKYDMASNFCALGNSVQQVGQNIMLNDNNNYRALHDEIVQIKMDAKDETIATLRQQLASRDNAEINSRQSEYLLAALRPQPVPAYTVPNPWVTNGFQCGCGC